MNSCVKGKRGEREAAEAIRTKFGVPARRGQQFSGGKESPDISHGLTGLHLEVKRTEKLQLWPAMDQAVKDAGNDLPAVLHRPNRRDWILILKLSDVPRLARIVAESQNAARDKNSVEVRTEQPATP